MSPLHALGRWLSCSVVVNCVCAAPGALDMRTCGLGALDRPAPPPRPAQWVLQLCSLLAEVPQPMMALRLLLAAGLSASEEAGLEMLAYQFFEEVGSGALP